MPPSSEGRVLEHRAGLPPVVGNEPQVLMLGTIPSVLSDRRQEYYGNPQNQFWRLVHQVFGEVPSADYQQRLGFLRGRGIALWDVLQECDIDQSKDHSIVDPVANDLRGFLRKYPSVSHIFFNGQKAYQLFQRLVPEVSSATIKVILPSSSPARALPFPDKLSAWKAIGSVLETSYSSNSGSCP